MTARKFRAMKPHIYFGVCLLSAMVSFPTFAETYYEVVAEWGVRGTNTGEFVYGPGAIAVDDQDRIFVMDAGASELMVFTTSGLYLTNWPIRVEIGEEINEVALSSIAFDDHGNAFFAVVDLHLYGHERPIRTKTQTQCLAICC